MAKPMSKSDLISKLAEDHADKLTRKDVKSVLESLATIGYKELKKTGTFLVPGFAKFVVIKKPATKERKGINPFTKEPTVFKAKPARKIVRARPVKAAKDAVA
jgi:DNA-binding protein HU-beta